MPPVQQKKISGRLVVSSAAARPRYRRIRGCSAVRSIETETRIELTKQWISAMRRACAGNHLLSGRSEKDSRGAASDLRYGSPKGLTVGMEDFATVCTSRWLECRTTA